MSYILSALALAVPAAIALLVVLAFRSEYLVAFRYRDQDFFLLERNASGRYDLIPTVRAPLAVWRYARSTAIELRSAAPRVSLRQLPERRTRAAHA